MCFLRLPVLCVWNSETGTGFYPEIPTVIKTGILHRQKHHRISIYWTCEAVLQSGVSLMHEKIDFRYSHLGWFGISLNQHLS